MIQNFILVSHEIEEQSSMVRYVGIYEQESFELY